MRYEHIFLQDSPTPTRYAVRGGGGPNRLFPERDREQHARKLQRELDAIRAQAQRRAEERTVLALPKREGTYLEFSSAHTFDLKTESLEDRRSWAGIRLLSVRTEDDTQQTFATVYVPKGREGYFLRKVSQYAEEQTEHGRPKNQDLVNSIEDVRLAVVESFWRDAPNLLPEQSAVWCEAWLRVENEARDDLVESQFRQLLALLDIPSQDGSLRFPERIVLALQANRQQLADIIEGSDAVAMFRLIRETARFWVESDPPHQNAWTQDLLNRLSTEPGTQVAVCVLDSGVNNGHPLLAPVLTDEDCQSCVPEWGSQDHDGHGTLMSGLAAYGDLQRALESRGPIHLTHCLESVKLLPPRGKNSRRLYGHITQRATSLAEIQSPRRKRVICMAVTAPGERDRGRPSSWSAAIDALTSGCEDGHRRLLVVSAGNVDSMANWKRYPHSNQTDSVHDPGQAWNALTVGAYTEKTAITHPDFDGYVPLAQSGELSPHSTTSLPWEVSKWPAKPDIVLEGGNLAKSPDGTLVSVCDDLSLLSTYHGYNQRHFGCVWATSAATAQAACLAAHIQALYPQAWPETIRGLMVHSAEWTEAMQQQFVQSRDKKTEYARLLRICGYGVPNAVRAAQCAANSLTLIAQAEIQPFVKERGARPAMKDMHVQELPWPREELLSLGEEKVKLRITLSYFVEPGPGEISWRDRYRYASHALRFDLNSPNEARESFLRRLNFAAREDGEQPDSESGSDRWTVGSKGRNVGSIHSDIWEGTAADIAACNLIGVYPVVGWWRERAYLGRCNHRARYSLIVSITTRELDIYTPVAVRLNIPIPAM